MLADGLCQSTERLQPNARRPATPPLKLALGGGLIGAGVNSLQCLAQSHCPPKFGVLQPEISSLLLPFGAQIPAPATQPPARPLTLTSLHLPSHPSRPYP